MTADEKAREAVGKAHMAADCCANGVPWPHHDRYTHNAINEAVRLAFHAGIEWYRVEAEKCQPVWPSWLPKPPKEDAHGD